MGYFSKFWLKITRWPSIHQSVDTGADSPVEFHTNYSYTKQAIVMRAAKNHRLMIDLSRNETLVKVPLMFSHGARFECPTGSTWINWLGVLTLCWKQPVFKCCSSSQINGTARHLCVILNHRGPVRHAKKSNFLLPQSFRLRTQGS